MKKLLSVILVILTASFNILGQSEKNYGYPLMPLSRLEEVKNFPEKRYQVNTRLNKTNLSPSVDYSNLVKPALDQGQQGSCVAFALTYGLSFLNNQKFGYSESHQYSQALIYNLGAVTQNGGMGTQTGLDIIKEIGYVSANLFPYSDQDWTTLPNLDILKVAIKNRASDWSWFPVGDAANVYEEQKPGYTGINMAKELLATGKTVILAFALTEGYGGMMQAENWIYSYSVFGQLPFTGAHALCLVGYNDTLQTKDGRGAFKVINSWGADKFDSGYSWITYKMLAEKNYQGFFSTFELRDNYQPQFTVTFDFIDFSNLLPTFSGLKANGQVSKQQILRSFVGRPQNFLKQVIIDLTDLSQGIVLNGKNSFFLEGAFYSSKIGSNKPTIKGIRITDSVRGIDIYQSCNIVLRDSVFHVEWEFDESTITDVEKVDALPTSYSLSQNYPNPFNPITTINFSIVKSGLVTLKVYNLLGQEVALLVNEDLTAGAYNTKFDAGKLASGIYVYVLHTADYTASRKMILMK